MALLQGANFIDENGVYENFPNDYIINYPFNAQQQYFQFQELYLYRLLPLIFSTIKDSYSSYASDYQQYVLLVFVLFLIIQCATLIVFRRMMLERMKADILQSRGILNLIPNHIIEQNK